MPLKKKLFLILLLFISAIPLAGDGALTPYSTPLTTQSKEVPVYATKTGKKYHRGDCRYLRQSKIKIPRKDAIAYGYTPCKVCKP